MPADLRTEWRGELKPALDRAAAHLRLVDGLIDDILAQRLYAEDAEILALVRMRVTVARNAVGLARKHALKRSL